MTPGISITMDPIKTRKFLRNLNKIALHTQSESQQVLIKIAYQIMAASQAQVPVETAALLQSAFVDAEVYRRSVIQVNFGYGGPKDTANKRTGKLASSYAVYVHERLDLIHPIGKAKFLEDPVNEYVNKLLPELVTALGLSFGGDLSG
jgi:hypothetical protein